jgi:hypothetical protein
LKASLGRSAVETPLATHVLDCQCHKAEVIVGLRVFAIEEIPSTTTAS